MKTHFNHKIRQLLFFIGLVVVLSEEANGISLGRKLFHNDKKNELTSTSTNNGNKIDDQLNADATGTVTALEPGKEPAPITCNEIMAKAVIISTEERDAAIEERNEAQDQIILLKTLQENCQSDLKTALEKAKNATVEVQAVKLMTDRLLNQQSEEYELKLSTLENSTEVQLQDMQNFTELQRQEYEAQAQVLIQDARDNADMVVKQAKESLMKNAQDMQLHKDSVKKETEALIGNYTQQLLDMETQYKLTIQDLYKLHNKTIEDIQTEHQQEIYDLEDASNKRVFDLEQTLEEQLLNTEALVIDVQKQAEHKIKAVEMECVQQMEEMTNAADAKITQLQKEIEKCHEDAKDKEAYHNTILSGKLKQIEILEEELRDETTSFTNENTNLKQDLEDALLEVEYWKGIHKQQTYVNTTMILLDSRAFYEEVKLDLSEKFDRGIIAVKAKSEIVWKDVKVAVAPYRAKAYALYEEHGKEIVDTKLLPFYQEQIRPFYIQHIVPLLTLMNVKVIVPSIVKVEQGLEILEEKWIVASQEMFVCACKTMEKQAGALKAFLISKDLHSNGANYAMEFLADIEKDASSFITFLGYIVAFVTVYRFKYHILSFIWFLMVLPFRVVWFFFPLRLLMKRNVNKHIEEEDDEDITSLILNKEEDGKDTTDGETSNGDILSEKVKKEGQENGDGKEKEKTDAVLYMPEKKEEAALEDEDSDAKVTNGETNIEKKK
ncbi:predicted protein [Chaetoceros tenuissimus]|uniref:Uncharacterized protein n=1 Tax=Chaetoceros tenuissimus TaxID=426638 RepID=A0AAD3HAX3_9STRA|nr:predicted protein [Chaetoceros tenuissimus]